MPDPSYRTDATHWRRYQPHLPPALRVEGDDLPIEERWAWRGASVHLDRFPAPGAATTVVLLHGGGGYGRMLAPLGRAVRALGPEVVLPDLPGYGLTRAPQALVRYPAWVACAADLAAAERATGRRVVLLGLSMGGMLAYHAAATAPPGTVAGVAATTLMDPRTSAVRRGAGRVPVPAALLRARALDAVRLPMPLLAPVERMSSSPAINRLCRRDPQGGGRRVPLGLLRSWMAYAPALEPEAFDRCPVLLAHPLADRWTPMAWSRAFADRLAAPTRVVGLERCEHWPLEEPGLTVLLGELAAFLGAASPAPAPAPPPGPAAAVTMPRPVPPSPGG